MQSSRPAIFPFASTINHNIESDLDGNAENNNNFIDPTIKPPRRGKSAGWATYSTPKSMAPPPSIVESERESLDHDDVPDGGWRAWLVVLGSWCVNFVVSGWLNGMGVFQDYYSTELFPNLPTSTVALVSSLVALIIFAGGPIFGLMYDNHGPKFLLAAGGALHVFGLLMASLASEHFYAIVLSQGICSAIGASMMLYPAISTISTWFEKKRALALGLTSTGGSIGGIVFPLMFESLQPIYGFAWAMRACALVIFTLAIVAYLTVASRVPPQPRKFYFSQYLTPFRSKPYRILSLAMLMYAGLLLPNNYIIVQAQDEGVSDYLAGKMVIILNAASMIGRTIPTWAADHVGRYNTAIVFSFFSTLAVFAFWVPLHGSIAGIITFAVFYGIFTGAVIALTPALIAQISEVHEIGMRTGTLYGLLGIITLSGNLTAGAIVDSSGDQFTGLKIFCGAWIAIGFIFLTGTRASIHGWRLTGKI